MGGDLSGGTRRPERNPATRADMTEICAECYEATKEVIRADPVVLREDVRAWIACGLFDDAVRARSRELEEERRRR